MKVQSLSPERQRDVLTFVEQLERTEHRGKLLFWNVASSDERTDAFRQWANSHTPQRGNAIPDEALRRENLYD